MSADSASQTKKLLDEKQLAIMQPSMIERLVDFLSSEDIKLTSYEFDEQFSPNETVILRTSEQTLVLNLRRF